MQDVISILLVYNAQWLWTCQTIC